jgi:hypothetical protein
MAVATPARTRSPVRDIERSALAAMRRIDVAPEAAWQEFIGCALHAGLTVRAIAEALPCAASTVSRWAAGKAAPPQFSRAPMKDLLVRLAEQRLR